MNKMFTVTNFFISKIPIKNTNLNNINITMIKSFSPNNISILLFKMIPIKIINLNISNKIHMMMNITNSRMKIKSININIIIFVNILKKI
jgi:hypothetical protein